jgi:RNA polymerase sigma factor (sigma-70 family)
MINHGSDWFPLYRQGETAAFETVFHLYSERIFNYALKILHDDSYAEDIVSETFNKAWDHRKRLGTPKHLENFLYLVTRNACIDYQRSGRAMQTREKEWVAMAAAAENDDIRDLERVQAELVQLICQHLPNLPGGDILRMSYLEGKSTKEIAAQLNITENMVYIAKSRSLTALRAILSRRDWLLFVLLFLRGF